MEPILFELQDAVGIIRLNRPEKMNAFNREMSLLMQKILDQCMSESIRAVYLTGNGRAFSAGQDLMEAIDGPLESAECYYLAWPVSKAGYPPLLAFRNWIRAAVNEG